LFQIAQLVTDKVRTEFISRGNYKNRPGGDRRRRRPRGRRHERHGRTDQLLGRADGLPLHDYRDRQHPAARCQKDAILWSNPSITIREEYDATSSLTNDPTGLVESVNVLHAGIERARARQQRVFAARS
jgi:hypothetical protein